VGAGRFEADVISGIARLDVAECQITATACRAAAYVHREPRAHPPVNPLTVEYRRRLVSTVRVFVPPARVAFMIYTQIYDNLLRARTVNHRGNKR